MTKEQVFLFAQQCWPSDRRMWSVDAELPRLERFAKLVGNAKLEQAAKECMKQGGVHDAIYAEAIESLKEPTP